MGQTRVWQGKRSVEFLGGHLWIGRIDHRVEPVYRLQQPSGVNAVGFLLNVAEVFGMGFLVFQTFGMGVQHYVVGCDASRYVLFL